MARLEVEHKARLEAGAKAQAVFDEKARFEAEAAAKLQASLWEADPKVARRTHIHTPNTTEPTPTLETPKDNKPTPEEAKSEEAKLGWQPEWHEGPHKADKAAQLASDDDASKQRLKQALREKLRRLQSSASELRSSRELRSSHPR